MTGRAASGRNRCHAQREYIERISHSTGLWPLHIVELRQHCKPATVVRDTPSTIRLFKTRSLGFKVFALVIAPSLYGAITGIALGASAAAYWVLLAIGVVGAIFSGYEHAEPIAAIGCGSLSAALFTGGLLGILWITGATPRAALPAPGVFVPVNCIVGALIGAAGSWRRRGAEGHAPVKA